MNRRDTLRKCTGLGAAGFLGLLAGCSGGAKSDSEQSASLRVKTFEYREGDSGNLVVPVTVENRGEAEGSGYLYVTVTAAEATTDGETEGRDDTVTARESQKVTVPAGETKTVSVAFELDYSQFARDGSVKTDLRS